MSERAPDGTAYDLSGPEEAPVVVLIHGLGLCRAVFAGLLPSLADHRVLAYDLYGHGQSALSAEPESLTVYARQLKGLMDHCGVDRAVVIGFSIGGMINRRFALDYPDRCSGLVILNSPHDRGAEGQAAVEARAQAARGGGSLATMDAALERWFTPDARADGTGPAQVVAWRGAVNGESYAQAAWVLAAGVPELIRPTPPIALPTLVMTCADDPGSTPDMSHAIGAEIAGSDVVIVPGLRHLGLMEDPRPFGRRIARFLSALPV